MTGVCLDDNDAAVRVAYVLSRLAEVRRTTAHTVLDPDELPEPTEEEGQ